MSTSHYSSRPYQGPTPPLRNTRRFTAAKLGTIGALLLVDILAMIGAQNLGEALTFAGLIVINLWALNR